MGIVYDYKSDYIKSLDYYTQSLAIRRKMNDQKGISESYANMAIVYEYLGKFPEALKCHYDALIIDEKLGNKYGVGVININMASVYNQQQKQKESLECLYKAKKIFTELKSDGGLGYAESGIGIIYLSQGKYKEAEAHIEISKKIFTDIGDRQNVGNCLVSLGQIYMQLNKFKESEKAFKESLAISNEVGDRRGTSMTYLGFANLYSKSNSYPKAKLCMDSAISIAKNISCVQCLKDHYASYAQIDSTSQNFKGAFLNLKLFIRYNDSLVNDENNKKSSQAKLQYDFDKKAIADSLKNVEAKIKEELKHEQEIQQQKTYSYGAALGFTLMLVIAGISYRAFKQKQKTSLIIEQQKNIVEEKQKEIIDSIQYAKRIQNTLLAENSLLQKVIPNHFVLFKPKDIVSGDFYWATLKNDIFYLAVCDCTGHGVPGAFMSLLNTTFLNEAITEKNIKEPNAILNYVRQKLISNISQEGQQDGMDGILLCFDTKNKKISYAAAHNAPLLIHGNEAKELEYDKMPVGISQKNESFTNYQLSYEEGDTLYLFTDGFPDQFGGPKGKKFKYKQLEDVLINGSLLPLAQQSDLLNNKFEGWKGNLEQVDDVLIIGIKL